MRILITGASGLLGSNLVLAASDAGHHVMATSRTRPVQLDGVEWREADLIDPEGAGALLAEMQPDGVIHCAAATDVDQCEDDPNWAFALNRDVARHIAVSAREVGSGLVHISTDAVFDGSPGPHAETDEARPINVYGESKLAGEQAVGEVHPQAAIIRVNFYGWSPPGRYSLAEWFLENLRQGKPRPGFTDIVISPLFVNQLAGLLLSVLEAGLSGIYHIASHDAISKYELGVRLAQAFELDSSLIHPANSERAGLRAARPKDLSLRVGKIERGLETRMPDTNVGIADLRRLEHAGYRERLEALLLEHAG
ncbi:MAG: SDR family oxidoreductase [Anaerolineales bacterium]|nr:SDR family oxidoreductase [Anaerolineales bacterium]